MSILQLENVSFSANGKLILDNINFSVEDGDYILLSGFNGSGKSTLLKLIADDIDVLQYRSAKVKGHIYDAEHHDILDTKQRERFGKHICYVPQVDCFIGTTVLEELQIILSFGNIRAKKEDVLDILQKLHLDKILLKIDTTTKSIDKVFKMKIERLSGGQKKLVSIIGALIRCEQADLCLIDEPLNNLDIAHVRQVCNLLTYINRDLKKAIVLVTHCRVFPNIKREFALNDGRLTAKEVVSCFSCFGEPDEHGIY